MPGAVITINQPMGAGAGTPGVARRDLWLSQQIALVVGTGGNSSIEWALLSVPPGSSAVLANADQITSTFTPDVVGTYRVQLVTNGGGPGNVSIRVCRVRYTNVGALSGLGWALPGLGEVDGESNYTLGMSPNLRAWAEVWEGILSDIEGVFTSGLAPSGAAGGDLGGTYPNPTVPKINGTTVPTTAAPDIGKILTVTGAHVAQWSPAPVSGATQVAFGKLSSASNYVNSTTGYTDIVSVTITITGTKILAMAQVIGSVGNNGTPSPLQILDSTSSAVLAVVGLQPASGFNSQNGSVGFQGIEIALAPGTYTLKLQGKSNANGQALQINTNTDPSHHASLTLIALP